MSDTTPAPQSQQLDLALRKEEKALGVNLEELKAGGFIKQTQPGLFTVRLRCPAGRLPLARLAKIAEVAQKYGEGFVHLTVRQSLEIPNVHIDNFPALVAELREVGQEVASGGPRVRVPVACGGCEYNPHGLTDTQHFALEVDRRYFGTPTPHKFKITFAGCPNDCVRAREADLGFQGQVEPAWNAAACTGCGLCLRACREGALSEGEDKRPLYDRGRCVCCGDCIRACPTHACTAQRSGHLVCAGGKHGRHPAAAIPLAELVPDAQVFAVVDAVLAWYQQHGQRKERLGNTIARVGLESLRAAVQAAIGSAATAG